MSADLTLERFDERAEPGLGRSIAFTFTVHIVLLAALFVGVSWQNSRPEAVMVELWAAPPAPPVQEVAPPKPAPEPPKPAPEPPKPKVETKPEPRIKDPDIAVKARKEPVLKTEKALKSPPKPEPKPKPKAEVKPVPKPEPKPSPDAMLAKAEAEKRMHEEVDREQAALAAEREEAAMRELLAQSASAARARALADYEGKIRAKVRGNVNIARLRDLDGNPEAVFDVVQLPTGEVLRVTLRKSSGHRGYDEAVERAILKSSPLPLPEQEGLFSRELQLKFRPLDK